MTNGTKALTLADKVKNINSLLDKRQGEFAAALGVEPTRFLRIVHTAIAGNPELASCDPSSVVGAAMEAAQCGLNVDPTLGEGALVPFKGKARFLPGYRGLAKLAIETEWVRLIDAEVVKEKESFTYLKGTDERLEHVPYLGDEDPGKTVAAYAKFVMKSGDVRFVVIPRRRLEEIRRNAPGSGSEYSPWNTDTDEMFKKTAVKNGCKMVPLSPRAERALGLLDDYEAPARAPQPVAERDITPREQRRAGKQDAQGPQQKQETEDAQEVPPKDTAAPAGGDEPPPPGTDSAASGERTPQGQVLITDEMRAKLHTIIGKHDQDPKQLIEGIVKHEIARLSDLTVEEYWWVLKHLAPEEVEQQESFLD